MLSTRHARESTRLGLTIIPELGGEPGVGQHHGSGGVYLLDGHRDVEHQAPVHRAEGSLADDPVRSGASDSYTAILRAASMYVDSF